LSKLICDRHIYEFETCLVTCLCSCNYNFSTGEKFCTRIDHKCGHCCVQDGSEFWNSGYAEWRIVVFDVV